MKETATITLLICTRNRAESLRQTLASIARCDVPADAPVELLVVDNGSSDETRRVVETAELPRMEVRYVFESKPGLSNSRNAGLAAARGEILLCTDDDVRSAGKLDRADVPPYPEWHGRRSGGRRAFSAGVRE